MTKNNQENRFRNPNSALAASQEVTSALSNSRQELYRVLGETADVAVRHGNFTEYSGVPHRNEIAVQTLPPAQQAVESDRPAKAA